MIDSSWSAISSCGWHYACGSIVAKSWRFFGVLGEHAHTFEKKRKRKKEFWKHDVIAGRDSSLYADRSGDIGLTGRLHKYGRRSRPDVAS
jgi:hypothetical protein